MRRLLVAHLRHGDLEPVATLRTRRTGVRVGDGGSRPVADVTVDAVDVLDDESLGGAFAELEIELVDGDDDDCDASAAISGGPARASDGRPKVMRSLDATRPPPGRTGRIDARAAALLLEEQLRELERHDPGVRLGDEPEDLHRFRVATRRSRALDPRDAAAARRRAWTRSRRS